MDFHKFGDGTAEVGHTHSDVSGGWLRAATFGAMDGLVTNIALIAGVGGSGATSHTIIITGVAGLVAGAFSMALGEYTSVSTQNEQIDAEVAIEAQEIETNPRAELAELSVMFTSMGMEPETAQRAAEQVHRNPKKAVNLHITQELGLDPNEKPSPLVAAVVSFCFFAIGALVPLTPYLFGFHSLIAGLVIGGVGLLVAGAAAAKFTHQAVWLGALRQLAFGVIAVTATYGIGYLIGASVS